MKTYCYLNKIEEISLQNIARARKEDKPIKCTIVGYQVSYRYKFVMVEVSYFSTSYQIPFWDFNIDIEGCEFLSDDYLYNSIQIVEQLINKQFEFQIYKYEMGYVFPDVRLKRIEHSTYSSVSSTIQGFYSGEVMNNCYLPFQYSSSKNSIITSSGKRFTEQPNLLFEKSPYKL